MRISDWSSDVCSSDLKDATGGEVRYPIIGDHDLNVAKLYGMLPAGEAGTSEGRTAATNQTVRTVFLIGPDKLIKAMLLYPMRSEEHTSELQSLMRISYAVFCLKKKKKKKLYTKTT